MRKLYIRQKVFKITDHYSVTDENQNPIYYVDQDFKLIGNKVHVKDAAGREIFVIDKEILTFLPRYVVSFSDGRQVSLKSRFTFFKKQIDVESEGLHLELDGNFFDFHFSIYEGGREIGSITREFLTWGDTYVLNIFDESKEVFVLALMIAVDCIKDSEEKN